MVKRSIFISNCDGAISKNKSAFECTSHFVPEGARVYEIIDRYRYVNNHLSKQKKPIKSSTSKLVLPFLLAFDVNNEKLKNFSTANLSLLKNSKESLTYLKEITNPYIFSTNNEHYSRAVCKATGLPIENIYSTNVNLNSYNLSEKEKTKLKGFAWEIAGMPLIHIPPNAQSLEDLSSTDQATLQRIDKIFRKEIAKTSCKKIFTDILEFGASEKLGVLAGLVNAFSSSLKDVMYVGSDLTDVESMKLVQDEGGLTVSFNGDLATVEDADVVVLSDDYAPIAVLADLFFRYGKNEAFRVAGSFDKDVLWLTHADSDLLNRLFELHPKAWPKVRIVSEHNKEDVLHLVTQFRRAV
jgi:energy-converting hydrogenase A subunit R